MDCKTCRTVNRPYAATCARCGAALQTASSAAARRREWDALPAALREEFEGRVTGIRRRQEDHRAWLRKHRWTHSVIAGVLLSLTVGLMAPAVELMIIALVGGAVAGWHLNVVRGGAMRGAGYMVAALMTTSTFLLTGNDYQFLGVMFAFALLSPFAFAIGYLLGMKLAWQHWERSVLA